MTDKMRLAAVVVTYNRLDQIKITVQRLLAEPLDHLIVVDNCSTDGTTEWLAEQTDARLSVLQPESNIGGAGGFEMGLRHTVKTVDPDWIVVMDDDGRPLPGVLQKFRDHDLSQWDAIAASVRYPDGEICGMNRPVMNPFAQFGVFLQTVMRFGNRAAFHVSDAAYDLDQPTAVDGSSFVGLFISRAGMAKAGYPDGRLFIYAEDGLYTLGLTQAGGRLGFFPDIRFEHDCSSFSGLPGQLTPMWKVYYYHRNLLFLYRRAAGGWFWMILGLVLVKWRLKARLYQGEDRQVYLRLLRRAIWDGLRKKKDPLPPELMP